MANIVQQIQFATLEDFIKGQNNYYAHFWTGNSWAESRRIRPHFRSFQESHPEMEADLTKKVTEACTSEPPKRIPYEELFESYKLMSEFVFDDNPAVLKYIDPARYLVG